LDILGNNIGTIKKNKVTLTDTTKKVGLAVNAGKTTKCTLLSHDQNVGQNHDMKVANRSFENVAQLRYFGMTVTNQNLIQVEIKKRLNLGNACYHSVQNLMSVVCCLKS
jgi:hypothetical protein